MTLSTFDPPLQRTGPSRTVLLIGATVAALRLIARTSSATASAASFDLR